MEKQREAMGVQKKTISGHYTLYGLIPMGKQQWSNPCCKLVPFDSANELWKDYWQRFETFSGANQIPDGRKAQIFLNNQSPSLYEQFAILAGQQNPSKEVNKLSMCEIQTVTDQEFDSKHFIIRERFKFWSDM